VLRVDDFLHYFPDIFFFYTLCMSPVYILAETVMLLQLGLKGPGNSTTEEAVHTNFVMFLLRESKECEEISA